MLASFAIVPLFKPLTRNTFGAILSKTTANAFSLWLEEIHDLEVFGYIGHSSSLFTLGL